MLAEIDPHGIYKEIREIIDALPDHRRTDDDTYRKRLEICMMCGKLSEGTCLECGCYVELRAARKEMYCPDEKHFW